MHHVRLVLLAIVSNIGQAETLGQIEVELYGGALPEPSDGVANVNVDLGAVEYASPFVYLVGDRPFFHCLAQRMSGQFPLLIRSNRLFRFGGQHDFKLGEIESSQQIEGQVENAVNFVLDLVGPAKDVRVVLSKTPHAHHTVEHASALIPVDSSQFAHAHRQVAVASQTCLVVHNVEGAVHRLEVILLAVDFGRGVHTLLVESQVTAGFPKRGLSDMGCVDQVISIGVVLLAPKLFEYRSNPCTLGMPDNQAWTDFLVYGEQIKLAPQYPMVTPFGLFQLFEVRVQGFLGLECSPVDPLEHFAVLIASPVRSCQAQELEGRNFSGRLDMRAGAQVFEISVCVRGDGLVLRNSVDDLQLQRLIGVHFEHFFPGVLGVFERKVAGDHLAHASLDLFEVFLFEWFRGEEIVVKPVICGRADSQFDLREHPSNYIGHDVGGRMSDASP